jgi:hypothetical protein
MTDHELPLPDYDSLPVGAIESRARTLDASGVRALLDYENEHACRVQVVQILQHRLDALESGDAHPSGGDPGALAPEAGAREATHAPQASPQTQGPPVNPPSHGDPANPAQPRT